MRHSRFLFALALVSASTSASVPSRPPMKLSGTDVVAGAARELDVAAGKKGTVVAFLSAHCPCSASHETALKALSEEYGTQGFQFIAVHSNLDEDNTMTDAHFRAAALPFPVLQDRDNEYANAFNALKTPHVFVLSPSGDVLYQGGVDDSKKQPEAKKHYLKEVLAALNDGKPAPYAETRTLGCIIKR